MAINLNHDTDTITATSGTLNLPNFSGGGGGGLTHFVESESTASPNATVPVDALTATDAGFTNIDVAIVPKGSGALLAQVPDGTTAGGNKRGARATDFQRSRYLASQVASGSDSVVVGGDSNTASNFNSTVVGGSANTASGNSSFVGGGNINISSGTFAFVGGGRYNTASAYSAIVAGGYSNTASIDYSFIGGGQSNTAQTNTHATVCGGQSNTASQSWSSVGGGYGNTASGNSSCVAGGNLNTASGVCSFIGGGINNAASGSHSAILGGRAGTTRYIAGYQVFPACVIPIASTQGVTQSALLLLGRQTTDATATVLTSDPNAASTTNQVILPNNSAYSFTGEVIAGVTAAGDTARWEIKGAIKRGASAATTAMVGTPTVTMTHNDAGAAAWTVAVTADTTNGGISVTVTGAASTTIRWVAKLNTTEMSY